MFINIFERSKARQVILRYSTVSNGKGGKLYLYIEKSRFQKGSCIYFGKINNSDNQSRLGCRSGSD